MGEDCVCGCWVGILFVEIASADGSEYKVERNEYSESDEDVDWICLNPLLSVCEVESKGRKDDEVTDEADGEIRCLGRACGGEWDAAGAEEEYIREDDGEADCQ